MNHRVTSIISFLNLALILAFGYYYWTSRVSLAYVESAKLVSGFQGMQDARKAFQIKATAWKGNIDTLTNEVKNEIAKFEKESPRMTTREVALSKELINTKQKQLVEYQQAMNSNAQQEDAAMTKQVMDQINAYLKKYGKKHEFRIIMATTEFGNIAYADEGLDVTDEVLEGLNKEYAGK